MTEKETLLKPVKDNSTVKTMEKPSAPNSSKSPKDGLIAGLKEILSNDLAAINQYTLHAGALGEYKILLEALDKYTKEEMKNAQKISLRILQLGGVPSIEMIKGINYGRTIEEQLLNDLACQAKKIDKYNEIIRLSKEQGDDETMKLLQSILADNENYKNWIESQIELVKKKETVSYLPKQKS